MRNLEPEIPIQNRGQNTLFPLLADSSADNPNQHCSLHHVINLFFLFPINLVMFVANSELTVLSNDSVVSLACQKPTLGAWDS